MTRQRIAQQIPPSDLTGLPTRTDNDDVYRAARLAPWWFCTCGDCRFDLDATRADGHGTMYCGTNLITGVLEVIGPELMGGAISQRFLEDRTVWALAYNRAVVLADLTADRAIGFGVTNELSVMVPYSVPQSWAMAIHEHGLDGIAYRTRFNTGTDTTGVALFDEAGSHPRWPARRVSRADHHSIVDELARHSVTVEQPPVLASLIVL